MLSTLRHAPADFKNNQVPRCLRNGSVYFKAENLVLRARSESVGFAEIVNKDRMVGINAFVP